MQLTAINTDHSDQFKNQKKIFNLKKKYFADLGSLLFNAYIK